MKKKILILISIFFFVVISVLGKNFLFNKNIDKDNIDAYININELDEEFMDKYYSDMEKLTKNNNLDNVLLVISKERPNNYGATMVVEAPNSTYILEYKDEYERDIAKERFEKDDSILSVTENKKLELYDTNTSNYNSWGIEKAGLNHAIEYVNQNGGEDVTVAIIDTGCDMNLFNQSYNGKITEVYNYYSSDTYGTDFMFDHYGHGTHIAGTIAESTPNNVKIIPFKVSDTEFMDLVLVIESINYITKNHKADVINMSFGMEQGTLSYDPLYFAIEAAKRENIISVAAAGNSGAKTYDAPAYYDNTISVSAVDSTLNIADFSTYNEHVTFAAPGVDIKSINGVLSGTSMATPHVVSEVAFIKSIKKDIGLEGTINALKQNVIDLGTPGRDDYYGYGFVDLSSFSICDDNNVSSCTSFDKDEEEFVPVDIIIESVTFTPYNYLSLTNLMPTEIKLIGDNNDFILTRLDKLDDIEIEGYDPTATGEQTLTLTYKNIEKSFRVSNPDNYELGWVYQLYEDDMGNKKDYYSISGYKDNNLQLEKLYFPESIEGNVIHSIDYVNPSYYIVFGRSNDAKYYKEVYLPDNIKIVGEKIFSSFTNLYKVTSDSDELELGNGTFYELKYLTTVDANIVSDRASYAFFKNYSLKEVSISENSTKIPNYMFYECLMLENVNIPEGVTTISPYAFYKSGLRNIILPDSIQSIDIFAFNTTVLNEVNIPKNVTFVGQGAFSGVFLDKITVDDNNTVYDSRNNSNAIIKTEDNTLVVGSNKTVVPDTVKSIGPSAFENSYIIEIEIPEGVESIGESAFKECTFLKTVKMPRTINSIADNSFETKSFNYSDSTIFYVYSSTYAEDYVDAKNKLYVLRDITPNPPKMINRLFSGKIDYLAFQTLDLSSYSVKITYEGISENEIVSEFKRPKYYSASDGFRYGDWAAWLYYDTAQGYHNVEMEIPINIGKATPEYEIPTEVYANVNSTLADVDLPEGFEWEDDTILLTTVGNVVYDAKYIPEDTDNYEIVEDIAIPIHVINKTLIKPTITVQDKEYDGTNNYPISNVTITGIDKNDYTSEIIFNQIEVGKANLGVKLRLTDEKAQSYSFSNGKQEKTFNFEINVLPTVITAPTWVEKILTYNGEYQTVMYEGFDSNTMIIEGNTEKDVGLYYATISLKDKKNNIWDNGRNHNLVYRYEIHKANIEYTASDVEVTYDGNEHGISIEVSNENAIIKYMDTNGEYTLNEMPKYTDVGEYTIKYQIEIDQNYNTVTGENTLRIIEKPVTNKIISFYSNTGTDEIKTQEVPINEEVNLNRNTFLKEGYIFKNWNTNRDGSGTSYDDEGKITITDDIILYVQWEKIGSDYVIDGYDVNDVDNYIKGINAYTTVTDFKNNITLSSGYSVEVDSKNVDGNDVLYTGGKTKIYNGDTLVKEYDNIIMCDTNSDGKVNILDIYNVYLLFKNKNTSLTNIQKAAADYDNNGEVNIMDLYRTYLKMKGKA